MLAYLADEDFNGSILRELRRRIRRLDLERIQEIGRAGRADPENLAYAAGAGRILLTHDKRLIPSVVARIDAGRPMPGVFVVHQTASIGQVLDDLEILTLYSFEGEWNDQVVFIPLAS